MAISGKTKDYKILGSVLRKARLDSRLSQTAVARRFKQDQVTISQIELGKRRLDVVELYRLCRIIGIKPTEFMERFERAMRRKK